MRHSVLSAIAAMSTLISAAAIPPHIEAPQPAIAVRFTGSLATGPPKWAIPLDESTGTKERRQWDIIPLVEVSTGEKERRQWDIIPLDKSSESAGMKERRQWDIIPLTEESPGAKERRQ